MALVSGALRPLRGRGPVCLSVVLRVRAGTGYCASSVHEKNTSPQPTQGELCAVRPGEAESSEVGGQKRKLAKTLCGIKDPSLLIRNELKRFFLKAFDNNFKQCQLRPTFGHCRLMPNFVQTHRTLFQF